jgi:membrane protein YqaA with SNARE-associated domain
MSTSQLIDWFGLYLGSLVFSFVSGVVPLFSVEVFLLAVGALTRNPWHLLGVTALTSLGQLLSKLLLYASGRGLLPGQPHGRLLRARGMQRLSRLRDRLSGYRGSTDWLLFISSLVGLPPSYLYSIVCGMMGVRLWRFSAISAGGFLLRFACLVYLPQLVQRGLALFR